MSEASPILGEYGSEVSCFIPKPRNFAEVTILSEDIKKHWLKENMKEIKNLINNQNVLVQDPEKGEPVTPCIDVYKEKMHCDGSLDKLRLRIVVRGYLNNKERVGDTWSPTAPMTTLKYFLVDDVNHKERVHQFDFIGAFLQAKVKNRIFVKLDSRYADFFAEYSGYFGRALRLLKSMYGMKNSGKLFADELTELLIESGFIKSQLQMYIYYKYAPDGTKNIVLSYVDDCVYWFTSEYLVKLFVDTLGKISHVNLLGYAHWFMSIRI